jgi:hypothetical protein
VEKIKEGLAALDAKFGKPADEVNNEADDTDPPGFVLQTFGRKPKTNTTTKASGDRKSLFEQFGGDA